MKVKLLNFNIAHGRGLSFYQGFRSEKRIQSILTKIAQLLKQTGASIVTLQEVDQDSHWNQRLNLLDILCDKASFGHSVLGVTNKRETNKPLLYGNAVLSKHPIHYWESRVFGEANIGEKGFMYVELAVNNRILPIINLHLDFRSRKRRIFQVEKIIDFLCERKHPNSIGLAPLCPIICGDFNSVAWNEKDAVKHLFKHMQEKTDYALYPLNAPTYPAILPYKGLDFIFVPHEYKVLECKVIRTYLSDHLPVYLEFEIPEVA